MKDNLIILKNDTFGGFYQGVFSLDSIEEMYKDYFGETEIDWNKTAEKIAENIAKAICSEVGVEYIDHYLYSPKTYNYENDEIGIKIDFDKEDYSSLAEVQKEVDKITNVDLWYLIEVYECIEYTE